MCRKLFFYSQTGCSCIGNIALQVATLNMKLIKQVASFSWLSMKNVVVLSFKYFTITWIMFTTCSSLLALQYVSLSRLATLLDQLHIQCCNSQRNIARLSIQKHLVYCKRCKKCRNRLMNLLVEMGKKKTARNSSRIASVFTWISFALLYLQSILSLSIIETFFYI